MAQEERYVVIGRARKSDPFDLCYIVASKEAGWRTARGIEEQEQSHGSKSYHCVVISETNYFEKKKMITVEPPSGFDFSIPVAAWKPDPRDAVPARVVQARVQAVQARPVLPSAVAPAPTGKKINPLFEMVKKSVVSTDAPQAESAEVAAAQPQEPTPRVVPPTKPSGFTPKKCPYCPADIPSNGAAQFSHLRKHVNELIARNVLTKEQGDGIRKTKLSPEMEKLFSESFPKTEAAVVA